MTHFSYSIHDSTASLPLSWDALCANNIFLGKDYLKVLEHASPDNMACYFVAIFKEQELCGAAVVQILDFSQIRAFGARDNCIKNFLRTFFFKLVSSKVLIVGNNMLTGENAFSPSTDIAYYTTLQIAIAELESNYCSQLTIWKDFYQDTISGFSSNFLHNTYKFSTQPNMSLDLPLVWQNKSDYVNAFTKKYRDQYKRARKKYLGITSRVLHSTDLVLHESDMHRLYLNVAQHAPFNTFFLPRNHFSDMKVALGDRFYVKGYFYDNQLIGFSTMIMNGLVCDTYFLGYDEQCQKEKMLYLNMLYDMIEQAIELKAKKIVLGRTALEIKSSVGAIPHNMYGYIKHRNRLINSMMPKLFHFFEPKQLWQQRHPFKSMQNQ